MSTEDRNSSEEEQEIPVTTDDVHTQVEMHSIGTIITYEVMESELDQIADGYKEANQALTFWLSLCGILATLLSITIAEWANESVRSIFIPLAFADLMVLVWFFIQWLRKRNKPNIIIQRIKRRNSR